MANLPEYNSMVAERYFELRKTYFDAENMKNRFRNYFKLFSDNGVDTRETERWDGVDGLSLDFNSEMEYISEWIDNRLAVLDKHFEESVSGIKHINTNNDNTQQQWYDLTGRCLQNKPECKGIYIRGGRKIVVR